MLYNIISNTTLKSTYAVPETEGGLSDIAFENGWRILQHAVTGIYRMRYIKNKDYTVVATLPQIVIDADNCIPYLSADEWNDLINTLYTPEESLMLCDSPNCSPYIEDVGDEPEDEYAEWAMLDEPETNDADSLIDVPHDFVEEFHALNQQ